MEPMDEDLKVTLDMSDLATGPLSHFGWCEPCRVKQQEIDKLRKEQSTNEANFKMLKKKIIATDQLLRQYKAKCLECEAQNKQIEEWVRKYEKNQRELTMLESQLMTALAEMEPVKNRKKELEEIIKQKEKELETLQSKLDSAELLNSQYEMRLTTLQLSFHNNPEASSEGKKANSLEQRNKNLSRKLQKAQDENKALKVEITKGKRLAQRCEGRLKRTEAQLSKYLKILSEKGLVSDNQVAKALAKTSHLDTKADEVGQSDQSESYSGSEFNSDLDSVDEKDKETASGKDFVARQNSLAGIKHGPSPSQQEPARSEICGQGTTVSDTVPEICGQLATASDTAPAAGKADRQKRKKSMLAQSLVKLPDQHHGRSVPPVSPATVQLEEMVQMLASLPALHSPLPPTPQREPSSSEESDGESDKSVSVNQGAEPRVCTAEGKVSSPPARRIPQQMLLQGSLESEPDKPDSPKQPKTRAAKSILIDTGQETELAQKSTDLLLQEHLGQNNEAADVGIKLDQHRFSGNQQEQPLHRITRHMSARPNVCDSDTNSLVSPTRTPRKLLVEIAEKVMQVTDGTVVMSQHEASRHSRNGKASKNKIFSSESESEAETLGKEEVTSSCEGFLYSPASENAALLQGSVKQRAIWRETLNNIHQKKEPGLTKGQAALPLNSLGFGEVGRKRLKQTSHVGTTLGGADENSEEDGDCSINGFGKELHEPSTVSSNNHMLLGKAPTHPVVCFESKTKHFHEADPVSKDLSLSDTSSNYDTSSLSDLSASDAEHEQKKILPAKFSTEKQALVPKKSSPAVKTTTQLPSRKSCSGTTVRHKKTWSTSINHRSVFPDSEEDDQTFNNSSSRKHHRNRREDVIRESEDESELEEETKELENSVSLASKQMSVNSDGFEFSDRGQLSLSDSDNENKILNENFAPELADDGSQLRFCENQDEDKRIEKACISEHLFRFSNGRSETTEMPKKSLSGHTLEGVAPNIVKCQDEISVEVPKKQHSDLKSLWNKEIFDLPRLGLAGDNMHTSKDAALYKAKESPKDAGKTSDNFALFETLCRKSSYDEKATVDDSLKVSEELLECESNQTNTLRRKMLKTEDACELKKAAKEVLSEQKGVSTSSHSFLHRWQPCTEINVREIEDDCRREQPSVVQELVRPRAQFSKPSSSLLMHAAQSSKGTSTARSLDVSKTCMERKDTQLPQLSTPTGAQSDAKSWDGDSVSSREELLVDFQNSVTKPAAYVECAAKLPLGLKAKWKSGAHWKENTQADHDSTSLHSVEAASLGLSDSQHENTQRDKALVSKNAPVATPISYCVQAVSCTVQPGSSCSSPETCCDVSRSTLAVIESDKMRVIQPETGSASLECNISVNTTSELKPYRTAVSTEENRYTSSVDCVRTPSAHMPLPSQSSQASVCAPLVSETRRGCEPTPDCVVHEGDRKPVDTTSSPNLHSAVYTSMENIATMEITSDPGFARISPNTVPCDLTGENGQSDINCVTSQPQSQSQDSARILVDDLFWEEKSETEKLLASGLQGGMGTNMFLDPHPSAFHPLKIDSAMSASQLSLSGETLEVEISLLKGKIPQSSQNHEQPGSLKANSSAVLPVESLVSKQGPPASCLHPFAVELHGLTNYVHEAWVRSLAESSASVKNKAADVCSEMIADSVSHELPDPSEVVHTSVATCAEASGSGAGFPHASDWNNVLDSVGTPASPHSVPDLVLNSQTKGQEPSSLQSASKATVDALPEKPKQSAKSWQHSDMQLVTESGDKDSAEPLSDDSSLQRDKQLAASSAKRDFVASPLTPPIPALPQSPPANIGQATEGPQLSESPFDDTNMATSQSASPQIGLKDELKDLFSSPSFKWMINVPHVLSPLPSSPRPLKKEKTLSPLVLPSEKSVVSKSCLLSIVSPLSPACDDPELIPDPGSLFSEYKSAAGAVSQPSKSRKTKKQKQRQKKTTNLQGDTLNFNTPPVQSVTKTSSQTSNTKDEGLKTSSSASTAVGKRVSRIVSVGAQDTQILKPGNISKADSSKTNDKAAVPLSAVGRNPVEQARRQMEQRHQQLQAKGKSEKSAVTLPEKLSAQPSVARKRRSTDHSAVPAPKRKWDPERLVAGSTEEKIQDLLVEFYHSKTSAAEPVIVSLQQLTTAETYWPLVISITCKLLATSDEDPQTDIVQACTGKRLSAADKKNLAQRSFLSVGEIHLLHLLLRIMETESACKKHQLMGALWDKIFTRDNMENSQRAALCRLYVGLCGAEGDVEQARVLGYWLVRCTYLSYVRLMLAVTAAWPAAFNKSGTEGIGVLTVLEHIIMTAIQASPAITKVGACLESLCGWVPSVQESQHVLASLVAELQVQVTGGQDASRVWELSRSIELLCSSKDADWVWSNFVERPVRSATMKWNARGTASDVSPQYLGCLLNLIGRIVTPGFRSRAKPLETFVRHCMRQLLLKSADIPVIEQSCVEALLHLSSFKPAVVFDILHTWYLTRKEFISKELLHKLVLLRNMIKGRAPYLSLDTFD